MSQHPPDWDLEQGSLQFGDGPPPATHRPLPAWNKPEKPNQTPVRGDRRRTPVRPRFETVLKVAGVLLILSATIAAGLVAMPDQDRSITSTVTPDPGLVIAASGAGVAVVDGTPDPAGSADAIVIEARYQDMVICLDPGHGGLDRGHQRQASAAAPAMDESHFNLIIANALRERLEQRGFKVVMTRTEDVESNAAGLDTTLDGNTGASGANEEESIQFGDMDETQARIDRCNDAKANVIVSIHFDASATASDQGSTVWYSAGRTFSPQNQLLATTLDEELELEFVSGGYTGSGHRVFSELRLSDAGDDHIRKEFLVLGAEHEGLKEPSAMPGVIVEVLTITNDNDAVYLSSDGGPDAIVAAFDRAIVRYLHTNQLD